MPTSADRVALLLSGGLDSGILLARLLDQGARVDPIHIDCGLVWQRAELIAIRRFLAALAGLRLAALTVLSMPVQDLYTGHWSVTGKSTPDAATPDEAVYLPGRNPLLVVKAAVWCRLQGVERMALATLAGNPFSDASDEFFATMERAMNLALGGQLRIERPFAGLHKREVMHLGRAVPLELTFSCIAPQGELHCGRCNKCGERRKAFADAGLPDRTEYAS